MENIDSILDQLDKLYPGSGTSGKELQKQMKHERYVKSESIKKTIRNTLKIIGLGVIPVATFVSQFVVHEPQEGTGGFAFCLYVFSRLGGFFVDGMAFFLIGLFVYYAIQPCDEDD